MYVTAGHHEQEVRLTLVAAVDVANALFDAESLDDGRAASDGRALAGGSLSTEVRRLLVEHGFTRASDASEASIERLTTTMFTLLPRLRALATDAVDDAVGWVNNELRSAPIEPSLIAHHGAPLHIHWTSSTSTFDNQVVADILMALALELVDHGTDRFGTCAADQCEHLFYDATRNRSRRFCADPRCASRTHTAHHRARRRKDS